MSILPKQFSLFKRYVREAKLSNPRFRFHSPKHTFASWLIQQRVPIYELQKLLGHSSVKVTEAYSHLAASELNETVNPEMLHLGVNKIRIDLSF